MKRIPLTQGKFAIVDDEDFENLNQFKWHAAKRRGTYYAAKDGGATLMHRVILGLTDSKIQGEHENGNGLDNRRGNLRVATQAQNCRAFRKRKRGRKTSRFRGVSWHECRGKWRANLRFERQQHHLGYFRSERAAARAYNEGAKKYFGAFTSLN